MEREKESIFRSDARFRELSDEAPVAYLEIDLLFADMVMPGEMTVWDLSSRLRAGKPGLKVILRAGRSQVSALREIDTGSRMAILRRPFDAGRLLHAVCRCLDSSGCAFLVQRRPTALLTL